MRLENFEAKDHSRLCENITRTINLKLAQKILESMWMLELKQLKLRKHAAPTVLDLIQKEEDKSWSQISIKIWLPVWQSREAEPKEEIWGYCKA